MAGTPTPPFNVLTTTAIELETLLHEGSLTSVQIIETYLAQIEKHNHAGAKLNAMITVASRELVLQRAGELDWERKEGKIRGPFHGLPIIVKDCFQFGPELGMKTTVGAYCFAEEKAKKNADVIAQLIKKGIIILGTANLSEFCGHKAENMTPGWSAYGGQTYSTYDTDPRDGRKAQPGLESPCGGSSAGSGVGVSAGFAPLSLGTETGGSLVYPAGKAGLYAIRPTLGTVSANGAFRITRSFDGIGGMAKTPSALAVLTENILAPEARGNLQSGGFKGVMTGKWDGLRIGIAESAWGTGSTEKWNSPLVKGKYEDVIHKIRELGGHVLFPAELPSPATLEYKGLKMHPVAFHEFNSVIREFCDGFEDPRVKNAKDIIKFNEDNAKFAMPEPHPNQKDLITSSNSTLTDEECETAAKELRRRAGVEGLGKFMDENKLDLIVTNSDCSLVSFTACSGYPSATVPLGNLENGHPFGLFLTARANREALIFRFMSAFEVTFPKIEGPPLI